MPSTLENPFTPKSALPVKRLFGGEEESKRKLSNKERDRIEKFKIVKYGELELFGPQAEFLEKLEKYVLTGFKRHRRSNSSIEDAKNEILDRYHGHDRIETDGIGNIIEIRLNELDLIGVPKEIKNLKKLKWLELSGNRIEDLPELNDLKNLQFIRVDQNNLEVLPDIDRLKKLKKIFIWGNRLKEEEIMKIKKQIPKSCEISE